MRHCNGSPAGCSGGMEEPPRISGPEDVQLVSDPHQIHQAEVQTGFPAAHELWMVDRTQPEPQREEGAHLLCVHHPWIQGK